ncbi:DUF6056 family protein [Xenorhabdus szentirmaii]|uniref:Inner membrane protein n=1 Tax=Xenorhabdus szentirmaii DSM 16338 TaxID=1427518 RepID=W1J029_9GAMM|nr:DUF6056 family protein [Xenorhabdus szentirmaii]PHM34352.1 inner membrane protein [Xenorhabdus szentirmaii DSM 16338]CDL84087.1 putative inner membrane protein [Xenorhabdus szentirmaii DSM 16338]
MLDNTKKIYLLIMILMASMVFYISYLTPLQSDDYSYLLKGLNLQTHINHYLYWSGRFVSDYISSLLLVLNNNIIKSIIIAIALVSMTFFISIIPSTLYKNKNNIYSFLFIFSLYWIVNPTLGQTVFWIVGAANYLFTNLFICIYLYFLSLYISGNKKSFLPLLIFSFFSGLSNENTSVIVVCISLCASIYNLIKNKDKKLFISSFIVIIGTILLICSPGNFARAANSAFEWWVKMPFSEKIGYFIGYTLPISLKRIYTLLATTIILLIMAYFANTKNKESTIISLLFLFAGLMSIFSMILAPTFPARALIGSCIFMIISCSFSFNIIKNSQSKISISLIYIIVLFYFLLFLYSYILISYSSNKLVIQESIRKQSIIDNIKTGNVIFSIPNFYWPKSFSEGDSVDTFSPSSALGKLYNVDNIDAFNPYFDYSILIESEIKSVDIQIDKNLNVTGIYIGKNGFIGGSSIALVINNPHKLSNANISIILMDKNGNKFEIPYNNDNSFKINTILGKNLIGFTSNINQNNINKIIINNTHIDI